MADNNIKAPEAIGLMADSSGVNSSLRSCKQKRKMSENVRIVSMLLCPFLFCHDIYPLSYGRLFIMFILLLQFINYFCKIYLTFCAMQYILCIVGREGIHEKP